MAEGFARTLSAGKIEVSSSGLEASHVDPVSVEVMAEIGIDISAANNMVRHSSYIFVIQANCCSCDAPYVFHL